MTARVDLRVGIDVGGTHTDAVVLDRDDRLLAKAKAKTSADVTAGVRAALAQVLENPAVDGGRVTHVMLGTTHATNAVLERSGLRRVAVVRIGGPATHSVRPLYRWPSDLRAAVSAGEVIVDGGSEFDGRDIRPFDGSAVEAFLGSHASVIEAVAITGVFSPASPSHEQEAAEIVRRVLGSVPVSLSHEIGSLGLLERENATVLNAALGTVTASVVRSVGEALKDHGMSPAVYFAQNDGTLMALDYALRFPVLTIGSGPANSLRGAAFLTGLEDAIVVDVGGTSTDIGMVASGFPRESSVAVTIGGVRTNFRMPDLVSLPIGGGTIVSAENGRVRLGPRSVGARLPDEALVFGGATPTLTDASVVAARIALGHARPPNGLRRVLREGLSQADAAILYGIDRMKGARSERPLIAVGGGSHLVPDNVPGVTAVHRPMHFEVANAIGAAIASVSGQVDEVVHFARLDRTSALEAICARACDRAVSAGADPARVEIVEVEETPLSYLAEPAVRVRAKATGPLASF